jgi:arylsulfatase A-like enzyme
LKLQAQNWIGGIFTNAAKKGDVKGWVDGTISFEAIHWNHPERAGDILVDYNWSDDKNNMGYAGTSFSRGVAGHGGFSPYEVHIALLAAGPSFKQSFESELPTSNVDITPTILHIHHIPVPAAMDGRVMYELLKEANKQPTESPKKETISTSAVFNGGVYNLMIERTILGKYKYVNFSKVIRAFSTSKTE